MHLWWQWHVVIELDFVSILRDYQNFKLVHIWYLYFVWVPVVWMCICLCFYTSVCVCECVSVYMKVTIGWIWIWMFMGIRNYTKCLFVCLLVMCMRRCMCKNVYEELFNLEYMWMTMHNTYMYIHHCRLSWIFPL